MKLRLIVISGLILAGIGGVFYFQIGTAPPAKRDSYPATARHYTRESRVGEARVYFDTGLIDLQKSDFKTAESGFRKALEIDPQFIQVRVALAKLYFATGNPEMAEHELLLATKSDPENEDLLHILGTYDSGTGSLDDHENLYQDLLKEKPDSLAAKKKLTELFIIKGKLPEARRYGGDIWNTRRGDIDAIYFDGRMYLAEKDYVRATEKLSYVTRQVPRFAPGHYFLGLAWLGTNNIPQAKIAFAKANELDPVWVEPRISLARLYLGDGDYNLVLAGTEAILQAQPRNVNVLILAGNARLKKGEIGQALDLFHRAKKLAPADPDLHINIGAAYMAEKKYDQALSEYEEALNLDPNRVDALTLIAQVLAVQGKRKAALDRAQQQLGKTENKPEVYRLLGQLSMDQYDYEKALSYLDKAVDLNPDLISAYSLRASIYMAQKKFDEALAESEKIIQKDPRAATAYMLLGTLHDRKQQYDQANRYYLKVLDLAKNSATAANNLAWNYAQHGGNLDMALTLAQKARELSPDDEGIAHTLGWIYYKKGAYLLAIDLLKESSQKFKNRDPTVLYHLGMAYRKNGDTTRAKESFSKALDLDQDFREAKEAKQALDEIGARAG